VTLAAFVFSALMAGSAYAATQAEVDKVTGPAFGLNADQYETTLDSYKQQQEAELVAKEDAEIAALREAAKGRSVGKFKAYAYSHDCDPSNITKSGTTPVVGRTIAADWSVLPRGTRVRIGNSDTIYVVEDTGGNIKGKTIDIYMNNDSEARAHGVRYPELYIVEGDAKEAQQKIDAILARRAERQAGQNQ
ncbi:MAG: 3D domain-containing protein, partial [Lachnoanaerobaculum sp.]|nr:3D domain-containing protein [Lachnoanaerobaculum sp.]